MAFNLKKKKILGGSFLVSYVFIFFFCVDKVSVMTHMLMTRKGSCQDDKS